MRVGRRAGPVGWQRRVLHALRRLELTETRARPRAAPAHPRLQSGAAASLSARVSSEQHSRRTATRPSAGVSASNSSRSPRKSGKDEHRQRDAGEQRQRGAPKGRQRGVAQNSPPEREQETARRAAPSAGGAAACIDDVLNQLRVDLACRTCARRAACSGIPAVPMPVSRSAPAGRAVRFAHTPRLERRPPPTPAGAHGAARIPNAPAPLSASVGHREPADADGSPRRSRTPTSPAPARHRHAASPASRHQVPWMLTIVGMRRITPRVVSGHQPQWRRGGRAPRCYSTRRRRAPAPVPSGSPRTVIGATQRSGACRARTCRRPRAPCGSGDASVRASHR